MPKVRERDMAIVLLFLHTGLRVFGADKLEQTFRTAKLRDFAWIFLCAREQAEKIVNRFLWKQRIVNIMHARKE